jgi:1-acyl-sn-glycerol-3-phosphate acyltransferase
MFSTMAKKAGNLPFKMPSKVKRILLAHTASVLADRLVQMAALGVALAASSKEATVAAWILFWATIPAILLAPLAGRTVDRWNRTQLMMGMDAIRMVLALGLMVVFRQMTMLPMLYLGVALVASCACFFTPARLAVVPNLVGKQMLFQVNAWVTTATMVMTLAGTAVGALSVRTLGVPWTFGMAALMYMASALVLASVREPNGSGNGTEPTHLWKGFRIIRCHSAVRRLVLVAVAISAVEAWFYVELTELVSTQFHLDILGFGSLLTALGAGLVGGILVSRRYPSPNPHQLLQSLAGALAWIAASGLLLAIVPSFAWALVVMIPLGMGTAIGITASDTLFQRIIPDRLQGRVSSARGLLCNVAFAGCVALAGWMIPHLTIAQWFIGVGIVVGWIGVEVWMAAKDLNLLYLILRWVLRPIGWWYCRTRRIGLERIPLTGPVLVAANHPSRMDAAVLITYSPRRLYFLAAETNWNLWWLGWICTKLGCVPVSKTHGNSNAVHTALQLLAKGKAVCIFPEGQIGKELAELKPGVAILAAMTGAPIVPIGLQGTWEAMPPHGKLRPHPVTMAVGEPIRIPRVRLPRVPKEMIERVNQELSQAIRWLAGQVPDTRRWVFHIDEEVAAKGYAYGC